MKVEEEVDPFAPSRKVCLDCRHLEPGLMSCGKAAGRKANAARLNPWSCGPGARLYEPKEGRHAVL